MPGTGEPGPREPAFAERAAAVRARVGARVHALPDAGEHETDAAEVNAAFRTRADRGELEGILAYSEEPLVSSDIVKSPYSSIFGRWCALIAWASERITFSTVAGAGFGARLTSLHATLRM